MRGAIVAIITIFVALIAMFVAGASVEPLGEHVKQYDSIDDGSLEGTQVINDTYKVVFQWAPMILIFGISGVWAIAWYIRRERFRGRGGFGP
jgi:ABC-type sulfate transport system permease subunit